MYAGQIVEHGDVHTIFQNPRHPYTIGLMDSLPKLTEDEEWLRPIPGPAAVADQPAAGLRVPPALLPLAGPAALPRRGAAAAADRRRSRSRSACHFADELDGRHSKFAEPVPAWRERAVERAREVDHRAAQGEEILRVEGLVKHFPIRAGLLKRTVGQIHAVDGVDLSVQRGRDARARRRVGLRQDDALAAR